MLERLAIIAVANERSLVEELNLAVTSYVLKEFSEHGERQLMERAFSDQRAAATQ